MKKLLFLFLTAYPLCHIYAQKPEKIYSLAKTGWLGQDYYNTQAKLWEEEVKKKPKDADAWKNYYVAMRYSNKMNERNQGTDKEKIMAQIITGMQKNVPSSVQYYTCLLTNDGNSNKDTTAQLKLIKKILALDPTNNAALEYYINYSEINGCINLMKDQYTQLYNSKYYANGIMECAYNILMSLDKNAIVFVCGDNDTYPLRMLQVVKGIRTDVTVINTDLGTYLPLYLKRLLKEKNIVLPDNIINKGALAKDEMSYLKEVALEINKQYPIVPVFFDIFCDVQSIYTDSLYCTGLAWRLSPVRIDNISRLKNNIENHFHLDYLDDGFYQDNGISAHLVEELNSNYVIPFGILYKHYLEMGESNDRTEFYKTFIMNYAAKIGKQKEMEEYLQGKRAAF